MKILKIYDGAIVYCQKKLYSYNFEKGYWDIGASNIIRLLGIIEQYLYTDEDHKKSYGSTAPFIKRIFDMLEAYCQDDKWLENNASSSLYKLLFTNGIWDFKLQKLIPFDKKIVFFTHINDKWKDTEKIKNYAKQVKELIFKNVFIEPNKPDTINVCDYIISSYARALAGHITSKLFFMLLGSADSGKGVLTDALQAAFSLFVGIFNADGLKVSDCNDDSARNRWALKLRFTRIIISNEISMHINIDVNYLKRLSSGGDTLVARTLFQDEEYFKPHFTLFLNANDILELKPYDESVKTRFRYVQMPYRFVSKPNNEREKQADDNIKNMCTETWFKRGLRYLLCVEGWKYFVDNSSYIPQTILNNREEYGEDSNLKRIIEKEYEITGNVADRVPIDIIKQFIKSQGIIISSNALKKQFEIIGIKKAKDAIMFIEETHKGKKTVRKYCWLGLRPHIAIDDCSNDDLKNKSNDDPTVESNNN